VGSFDLRTRIALTLSRVAGSVIFGRLHEAFGGSKRLAGATRRQLAGIRGLGPSGAAAIERALQSDAPELEINRCRTAGVSILDPSGFPAALASAPDAPIALYVRGAFEAADAQAAAIVGTRHASAYGRRMARSIASSLARAGATVVSGLARGIDSEAHQGALAAGGRTIAVLGCGLGSVYPPENARLADRIARGAGAVISELPFDEPARPEHFPRRNRIISGLAWATVCVEASPTSGAINTCDWALGQGRVVGAIPGPADSALSKGPHALLRQGAMLVEDAADILEEIPTADPGAPGDLLQRSLWDAVRRGARTVDRARAMAGLRANVAARVAEELVRSGWIVRDGGGALAPAR